MLTIPIAPREREHEHGVSLDIPNEQRQATSGLHTDIRRSEDHDGGKHEDHGAITGRPSEAAPERPHGGDQLGEDGEYPVGPGTYEGECWHTGNILSVNTYQFQRVLGDMTPGPAATLIDTTKEPVYGPDPTMVLDEKDTGPSRILFQENKSEDQGSSAAGISSPGVVAGCIEYRNDATGGCF